MTSTGRSRAPIGSPAATTTKDGGTYDNPACWVCRFDGDRIVEVRAYLDSAMIAWALLRNEPKHS